MSPLLRATCLGCGCTCDDISVVTDGTQVTEVQTECPLAHAWYEEAQQPHAIRIDGRPGLLDEALDAVAVRLRRASLPLIVLGGDLTCEAQRSAVALADLTRGRLDTLTGAYAAATATAVQRYGRVSATLGEFRHRADLVIFWGIDPRQRFPRLRTRFLTDARGEPAVARTSIAIDLPGRPGPEACVRRISLDPSEELATLTAWAAMIGEAPGRLASAPATILAEAVRAHRYVAVVVDGESGGSTAAHVIAGAFAAVARAINDVTRGGLCTLRGGGNRNGADAVLTWQTGYPMQLDFANGYPRYGTTGLDAADVTLVVGRDELRTWPAEGELLAIGPGASHTSARVAIDTGTAGIHEAGLAYRMDDVPVPVHALVAGPPTTSGVLQQLTRRCGAIA